MLEPLTFLSVCSGIEAASVAFGPLGWRAVGFSEIEPFPCSVLKHHYPEVPNYGDLTQQESWQLPAFDVLCGGTPCQGFSVAGKRGGLADARSQLVWHFLEIARRQRPRWVLWENVPGVLSSDGGNDFGAVLGRLGQCGYGFAYRVLDAQYFGVAQRRRRVFVVGYLGDWRPAAAVLFERESMSGNPVPRRETRESAAHPVSPCIGGSGSGRGFGRTGETRGQDPVVAAFTIQGGGRTSMGSHGSGVNEEVAFTLNKTDVHAVAHAPAIAGALLASYGTGSEQHPERVGRDGQLVAHALRAEGHDASEDGTGRGVPLVAAGGLPEVAYALQHRDGKGADSDTKAGHLIPVRRDFEPMAFKAGQGAKARSIGASTDTAPTLGSAESGSQRAPGLLHQSAVRRLTPRECERLQGFPDDYTLVPHWGKPAADGPRYKALGNSWAVPCARWIGERIVLVGKLLKGEHEA